MTANTGDFSSIDAIIAAVYDGISGPPGRKRDWVRARRQLTQALATTFRMARTTKTTAVTMVNWNIVFSTPRRVR